MSAYVGYTKSIQEVVGADLTINGPLVTLMIAGAVIFIIAFFGCCGAIRESHCMIVTVNFILLTNFGSSKRNLFFLVRGQKARISRPLDVFSRH